MPYRKKSHWVILLLLLLAGGAVFSTLLVLQNSNAVVRGVIVGETRVEKLTEQELRITMQKQAGNFMNSLIVLKLPDGTERNSAFYQLGAVVDAQATSNMAYKIGHGASLRSNIFEQFQAFLFGVTVPFEVVLDEETLEQFISEQLTKYHKPAQNIAPVYDNAKDVFFLGKASAGSVIDIAKLKADLKSHAENLDASPIVLEIKEDIPSVTYEGAGEALKKAKKMLEAHPFRLAYGDTSFPIEKEDWISWLIFSPEKENSEILQVSLSQKEIEEYLTRFAPGINTSPIEAEFAMEKGRVIAFSASYPGQELEIGESAEKIAASLLEAKANTRVNLVLNEIQPSVSLENINNLGIKDLLGRGETDFAGSAYSRAHNIAVGASKFQGALIAPGEEFSFNKLLGDTTEKEGYLPAFVIKDQKTIPEYGGGLCQVSTTLFRAAIYAGLDITKRYNHSYPVSYYGTPGFDATIYPPSPDLRFKNNTPGHILLQHKITGTKLVWEIYGTDDGRKVVVEGPVVYDKKPDGSMKAKLTQKVYKNESIFQEKSFYSNYKSPALYPIERNPLE